MIHKTAIRKSFELEAFPYLETLWQTSLWLTENEDTALKLVKQSFISSFRFWSHSTSETNCRQLLFKTLSKLFFEDISQSSQPPQLVSAEDSNEGFFYDKLPLRKAISGHAVNKEISGLLAEVKFVTLLSMFWGFSFEEIAKITDIEMEAVQTRLYWGHRLIRREFYENILQKGTFRPAELNRN
jgi:DNA-directed RNA polymerase specialized sigma24 family protein